MPTGSTAVISSAVADRAVGGAAAALRQDIVLLAEAHDVPNDEEVAGQFQLLDHRQLAFHLQSGPLVIGPVAATRALIGKLSQQAHLQSHPRERDSGGTRTRDRLT